MAVAAADVRQKSYDVAAALSDMQSRGEHGDLIRDAFRRFARHVTEDPGILSADVACYSRRSQAEALAAEFRLFDASIPEIQRIRTAAALSDVPIVGLSATGGAREDHRQAWTKLRAELAASVPRGRHVILVGTDHAVNQVRPGPIAEAIESIREIIQGELKPRASPAKPLTARSHADGS